MTRPLLLAGVALAAATAWWTGLYHTGPEHVADFVARAGIWGPMAFVALFVAAEIVHLPGILFVFAAAALWPAKVAIPTVYLGALAGSLVVFAIARSVVPAELRERLPGWLLRYESLLENHGIATVTGLRLVLFMAPSVHWLLGASRVSSRDFLLGTALGLLPGVIALTLLGRRALDHWDVVQPWLFGGIALLVGIAIVRQVRAASS